VVAFVLSILLALRFPPPPRRYRTGGARLHTELAVLQRKLLRRPRTPSIGSFGPPSVASGRTGQRGRPGRSRRPSWLGIVRVSAGIGALSRQRRAAQITGENRALIQLLAQENPDWESLKSMGTAYAGSRRFRREHLLFCHRARTTRSCTATSRAAQGRTGFVQQLAHIVHLIFDREAPSFFEGDGIAPQADQRTFALAEWSGGAVSRKLPAGDAGPCDRVE